MTNEEAATAIKGGRLDLLPFLWEQTQRLIAVRAKQYYTRHTDLCAAAGVTVEDLIQEAYFAILDAIQYFDPSNGYSFTTYLRYPLQKAFNALCGMRTAKGRGEPLNAAKSLYEPIVEDTEGILLLDAVPDAAASNDFQQAEETIYQKQLHETLEICLATLSQGQEAAIRYFYYENLSNKEIARILGCKEHQSRTLRESGLKILRYGKNRKRLEPYRQDIISKHVYHGNFRFWKQTGMSSTEYIALQRERQKKNKNPSK